MKKDAIYSALKKNVRSVQTEKEDENAMKWSDLEVLEKI